MTSNELRKKFLEFFSAKGGSASGGEGHKIIPGASLVPEHDPTVLFTTAGMHPLVPYLLGEKHPAGRRLANVQKCVRTGDIDSVGGPWHLTFFEMLGNWSLGDPDAPDGIGEGYWKKEAIEWSFEFLTEKKWLNISPEKISVTVFAGDPSTSSGLSMPRDDESARIWEGLGIPKERIYFLPKEDNWWGPAGQTGPCGPCTEMFYDTGKEKCGADCRPGCKCGKYAEIWNDVFMEYEKKIKNQKSNLKSDAKEREYEFMPLKQKNVDTGMGVERTTAVLNGRDNIYETELFRAIILKIKEIAKIAEPDDSAGLREKAEKERAVRIIADHIKAAAFILAEGVEPSNVERGYVLRRLIRRAVRQGKLLGIENNFTAEISKAAIEIYKDIYPELEKNKDFIEEQLAKEEEKFRKTLEAGLKEFEKAKPTPPQRITHLSQKSFRTEYGLSGDELFNLYSTYGFPIEMSLEEIKKIYQEYNQKVGVNIAELSKDDEDRILQQFHEEFHEALKKHQELSRTATAGTFKAGLADYSEQATKYHTATHLLLAALRQILGEHVAQKGSNITGERLRFDFSHSEKMTPEQAKLTETLVNEKIKEDLPIKIEETSLEEAKKQNATGAFEAKYGERVKVYTIGSSVGSGQAFSKEICGGPHVERTGVLGKFKIIKEEAISAGVRRIKAILE